MKLATHIKLEAQIISTSLFVCGIIISAGAMFEYQNNPEGITMLQICMTVGLTFFLGLISIHCTARSIRQTVVYLERKKSEKEQEKTIEKDEEQLTMESLHDILTQGSNISHSLVHEIARQLEAGQAALYTATDSLLEVTAGYALDSEEAKKYSCSFGEGLVGRTAATGQSLYIDQLPERYITIYSGLGSASPTFLALIPLVHEQQTIGVLELALFKPVTHATMLQLENIGKAWAKAGL